MSKNGDSTFNRDDDPNFKSFGQSQQSFGQSYTANLFKVGDKEQDKDEERQKEQKMTDSMQNQTFDRGSTIKGSTFGENIRLETRSDIQGLTQTQKALNKVMLEQT